MSATVAVGSFLLLGGCTGSPTETAVEQSPAPTYGRSASENGHSANTGMLPGWASLSPAEKLDRFSTIPGMHAVVEVRVLGPGSAVSLSDSEIATDVPVQVSDVVGSSRYRLGEAISLRIRGGTVTRGTGPLRGQPITQDYERSVAPPLPGSRLLVVDRDQGMVLQGNSDTRLVASAEADVITVEGDQATWLGYREPLTTMKARLAGRSG